MKRVFILVLIFFMLASFASAEIIINQQPKQVYNLGEIATIPVTVKTLSDVYGTLEMNLICSGQGVNFYRNGVYLLAGEEKRFESSLVLSRKMLGSLVGSCKIKAILENDFILTNEFSISSLVSMQATPRNEEILPGENIVIEGYATKQSGKEVEGFVQIDIYYGDINVNSTVIISQLESIRKGYFLANLTTEDNTKAGVYKVKLRVYEKDISQEVTNEGYGETSFRVKQLPTNIEIILENPEVMPGTSAKITTILHDQTGESILSNSSITIKDGENILRDKVDKTIGETYAFFVSKNEPPAVFKVIAETAGLSNEITFRVKENPDIDVIIANRTLKITNVGNVLYCNKTVLVKFGNQSINIPVCLEIGKEKEYEIKEGPNGEFDIEVITEEGDNIKERVFFTGGSTGTGSAISIEEAGRGVSNLVRYPFIWLFVMLIVGFMAFTLFRKGYKKTIIGNVYTKSPQKQATSASSGQRSSFLPLRKDSMLKTRNKAELSLSIQGEKQNASVVCLKIKNLNVVQNQRGSAEETLQKIVGYAEDAKALVYENLSEIYFIFAPEKTKTFQNEKPSLDFAKKIIQTVINHNHQFNQKLDVGLSLNYGVIIGKQEPESYKFMSMGTLMTSSKKIASVSNNEILLGERYKEKVPEIRAEKETRENMSVYVIKEIKENKDHEKFIKNFMQRNR